MADHAHMEDSVAAYALDACDEDEREAVRAHLEDCASCRALVARLTAVVDVLPLGSAPARPPERLRARILAAAASPPPGGVEPEAPARPGPGRRPTGERRDPPWIGAGRRAGRPALVAAVAAMGAGLMALAAWNVTLNQQLHQAPAHYSMSGSGALAGASATVTAYRPQDLALVSFTGLPAAA